MTFQFREFETKSAEDADPADIVTKALGDLSQTVEKRLADVESKSSARLDAIEARLARPAIITKSDDGSTETKAFADFVRRGVERMDPVEAKALSVSVGASGGFLAPESFEAEILKALVEFSPIRQYARTVQISAPEIIYPRRVTGAAATWVAETAARTSSSPTFEQVSLKPHELATYVDVSNALLEDNAYNLESELQGEFAEAFGKTEGLAFVKGTGSANNQPVGLMTATGITEVKTGVAAAFPTSNPADVLIGMYHVLPTAYAQRGVWVMNRNTLATIRKWKNTAGDYLVVDPITAGMAVTLLGRPIVEAVDMDDIGAGLFPIIFGDMQGYRIVDRIGLTTIRDPLTLAGVGQVRLHARRRVGADLTHPDRFVKLKVAA